MVLHTLANTGIPAAPTVDGTFPVYLRYRNQIMKGTNPDGTKYADPVQFVAYFNGGDAVHYFPRYSFGFPQSLGCVELSLSDAAQGVAVPDLRQPGHRRRLRPPAGLTRARPGPRIGSIRAGRCPVHCCRPKEPPCLPSSFTSLSPDASM